MPLSWDHMGHDDKNTIQKNVFSYKIHIFDSCIAYVFQAEVQGMLNSHFFWEKSVKYFQY